MKKTSKGSIGLVRMREIRKRITNFHWERFLWGNSTTLSAFSFISEIFHWNEPKSRVSFASKPEFAEISVNGKHASSLFFSSLLNLTFCHRFKHKISANRFAVTINAAMINLLLVCSMRLYYHVIAH